MQNIEQTIKSIKIDAKIFKFITSVTIYRTTFCKIF